VPSHAVTIFATSPAGVQVAEAVTLIAPCWFESALLNLALCPANADGYDFLAVGDGNGGGGHLILVLGDPQSCHLSFVVYERFASVYHLVYGA